MTHSERLSALKAWVEQDAEGRVMTVVEDPSIVEYVDDLVEQLEAEREKNAKLSALIIEQERQYRESNPASDPPIHQPETMLGSRRANEEGT